MGFPSVLGVDFYRQRQEAGDAVDKYLLRVFRACHRAGGEDGAK